MTNERFMNHRTPMVHAFRETQPLHANLTTVYSCRTDVQAPGLHGDDELQPARSAGVVPRGPGFRCLGAHVKFCSLQFLCIVVTCGVVLPCLWGMTNWALFNIRDKLGWGRRYTPEYFKFFSCEFFIILMIFGCVCVCLWSLVQCVLYFYRQFWGRGRKPRH